jgi:putative ABC transport system ATP-binding protein
MCILKTEKLTRVFGKGDTAVRALHEVDLTIKSGEFVAIMGPSGCGKSTLLNLIGGLDRPTSGKVILDGRSLSELKDDDLTSLRRSQIGFVFQFYNLIPVLRAAENAALPLLLDGQNPESARQKAEDWLKQVGLQNCVNHRPDQLSGGQQQRVAIVRALVSSPAIILADEPTGNLDSRAADEIVGLFRKIADEWRRTILLVTHDPRISAMADRIIFLKDGAIVDDARISEA